VLPLGCLGFAFGLVGLALVLLWAGLGAQTLKTAAGDSGFRVWRVRLCRLISTTSCCDWGVMG